MVRIAKNRGFSLVELMIALTLGLLLSAGVISVYVNSKTTFEQDEEVARLQESGRFALKILSKNLSMAGFFGGVLESDAVIGGPAVTGSCGGGWEFDISEPLTFVNDASGANANAALACIDAGDVYNDAATSVTPDVIGIKRAVGDQALEDGEWNTDKGVSQTSFKSKPNQAYLRIVYSTNSIELITVSEAEPMLGEDASVDSGVDYWKYEAMAFFIRSYSEAGDGIPTLCAERLRQTTVSTECLVEGVENIQIEFGIDTDTDGNIDYFTDDPTTGELSAAASARIYVLMRSINTVPGGMNEADRLYQMGNTAVAGPFNDDFYRRVFSTTVLLKNRFVF